MTVGQLPPPPEQRSLALPGGGHLVGMVDLPRGVSDDCRVNFNLMLQLGPIFGNLQCVLCAFKFLEFVLNFVKIVPESITNPTKASKLVDMLTNDLPEIEECLQKCIYAFTPLGLCPPIKAFLKLIASYLRCLVEMIESVAQQGVQIQIQMGDAQGNPELLEVLQRAQNNADMMGAQALKSCGPAFDLLQAIGSIIQAIGAGAVEVPSLDQLTGGEIGEAVQPLKDLLEILDLTIQALPC
jgi:hypothetical protein